MSGSGVKKVAEVAAKATKSIDWDGMAKLLVSDEARKEFSNLRHAFNEVNQQLKTKFSMEPEPINWDYYRKGIGSHLVDMFKQAYESKFLSMMTCLLFQTFYCYFIEWRLSSCHHIVKVSFKKSSNYKIKVEIECNSSLN
ncbi:hypothetical protein Cni_G22909 [Canna indica]|uniref:ATP synthase subunit d, mitochondrial n=1 Tax=Canna indica TaxID=4628 RepID=A0AAQ3QK06_9LILI|nr:hypothetical protein Cni_G22909 [Canna indica]